MYKMVTITIFLCVSIFTHKLVASIAYIPLTHILQRENHKRKLQEEEFTNTPDLLRNYGYPVEIHRVTTDDGYILTLHRIPFGIKSPSSVDKPAVLVQHGLISNSAEPLISGPEQSLGHYLADLGYDVWLGNTRGNRYSLKHVRFDSNERKYWDFSWGDMGYYDLPAMIDHILSVTNQEQLFYIGHSRGTIIFFAMCATRPEYNDKIRLMSALAPISYMSHISSPIILFIVSIWRPLQAILTLMGINHYTPSRLMWKTIGQNYCNDGNPIQYLCVQFFSTLSGYDEYFNTSLFPKILEHMPDTIISKDLEHFYQLITTGKFTRFNYGPEENLKIYNSTVPPEYNLSKIKAPVAVFYSDNDFQSNATDTELLYKQLGNPVAKVLVDKINHYSFFHGRHIREMLYNKVIELMKYY